MKRYLFNRCLFVCSAGLVCSFCIALCQQTSFAQDYRTTVLAASPIGYWGLDEVSGSVATNLGTLGSSANGSYFGANIQGDAGTGFAGLSTGIRLDSGIGSSGVTLGVPIVNNLSEFTLSAWINPSSSETSNRSGLFGQDNTIEFGFISSNQIQIWTPGGGSTNVAYGFGNDEWHHLVATGDGAAGELKIYLDGVEINPLSTNASVTNSYGSSNLAFNIGGGSIFGNDTQYVGAIDEVAVFDRALTEAEITNQYLAATIADTNTLQINRATGEATIVGTDEDPVQMNAYQITSGAGSLLPAGHNSLSDQGIDEIDHPSDPDNIPGSSTGESWAVLEASSTNITEGFFLGSTTLNGSVQLPIGAIYDTSFGVDATLQFAFGTTAGPVRPGLVSFVRQPGDYNDDGMVDAADYAVWRSAFGQTGTFPDVGINPDGNGDGVVDAADYAVWRDNEGIGVVASLASNGGVPEPTTAGLLAVGLATLLFRTRCAD